MAVTRSPLPSGATPVATQSCIGIFFKKNNKSAVCVKFLQGAFHTAAVSACHLSDRRLGSSSLHGEGCACLKGKPRTPSRVIPPTVSAPKKKKKRGTSGALGEKRKRCTELCKRRKKHSPAPSSGGGGRGGQTAVTALVDFSKLGHLMASVSGSSRSRTLVLLQRE